MDIPGSIKRSMDDIVFAGRNQAYGAFHLRRLYDKHMARAMVIAFLLFLLLISMPKIISTINSFLTVPKEEIRMIQHTFTEPPAIERLKPPPPPAPKVDPPLLKPQIEFIAPVVKIDDEVPDDEPPVIAINDLKGKEIAALKTPGNESGEDPIFVVPDPPTAPIIIQERDEDEIFIYVEQMPSFPDGEEALYKYLRDNIEYPAMASENRIAGQVVIQFVVSKEGEIQNAKIIKGLGGGLNQEALRVVNRMPKWKPGKHNGKPVAVTFTLPIKFVLQ